jgi:hypothetical protein
MSIFSSIGKAFRKVGEIVRKVAMPLLAVGAIVFTGGAALGLAPFAGGWGAAVAGGLGKLGISASSAIGSTLIGAGTQAGYGAAIGGVGAALTGQDISKGATLGGLAGAVTGGLGGAMNAATSMPGKVTMSSRGLNPGAGPMPRPDAAASNAANAGAASVGGASAGAAGDVAAAVTKPEGGGLLGGFLDRRTVGELVAGAGRGLLTGMAANDAGKSDEMKIYGKVAKSYTMPDSVYDTMPGPDQARPTPREKWGRKRWRYDPDQKRIVGEA